MSAADTLKKVVEADRKQIKNAILSFHRIEELQEWSRKLPKATILTGLSGIPMMAKGDWKLHDYSVILEQDKEVKQHINDLRRKNK